MKNRVVVGLLFIGIALILASLILPSRSLDFFNSNIVAVITDISTETNQTPITRGLDQYDDIPAKKGMKLRHLDILKTPALTEASLKLSHTDGEVRVLENSEILIETLEDKTTLITIRNGDLMVESFGEAPSFWIRKDGRQLTAVDYALSNDQNVENLRSKGQKTFTNSEVLQQSKIEEILTSKKPDFFRCYGQLIQKTEQAHGQVLISFEISNVGKVIKVDINRSDINDTAFKACLAEVVARTVFPKFSGQSITTVFPLKFD